MEEEGPPPQDTNAQFADPLLMQLAKRLPLYIIQYGGPHCAQCFTLWQMFELWLLAHVCGFDPDKRPCSPYVHGVTDSGAVLCIRKKASCIDFGRATPCMYIQT